MICIHCPIFEYIFHYDLSYSYTLFLLLLIFEFVLIFSLFFILSTFHSCLHMLTLTLLLEINLIYYVSKELHQVMTVVAWLFQCTYSCPIVHFLQLLIVSLNVCWFISIEQEQVYIISVCSGLRENLTTLNCLLFLLRFCTVLATLKRIQDRPPIILMTQISHVRFRHYRVTCHWCVITYKAFYIKLISYNLN